MRLQRFAALALLLIAGPAAAETFALVADLNGRYGSTAYHSRVPAAVESIIGLEPAAVISAGDMVAGQQKPLLESPQLDAMWREFNRQVADPLESAGIPLAVTPGNHDGSGFPEFHLEQEHFDRQWLDRGRELELLPGSQWPRRYAARLGAVLLLAFDGTVPGRLHPDERRFVADMLERHAGAADATIVFSHLPMWPLARGREHEILDDPDLLELMHRHGVDVYASGHHHLYYAGIDEGGLVHLAVGALGGNARAFSVGDGTRQPHSLAVLDITRDSVSIRAMAAPGFENAIDSAALPEQIEGPLGLLRRLGRLDSNE